MTPAKSLIFSHYQQKQMHHHYQQKQMHHLDLVFSQFLLEASEVAPKASPDPNCSHRPVPLSNESKEM